MHACTSLDAAQGLLLGLACEDAAGRPLEFHYNISAEEVAWALNMPEGGGSTSQLVACMHCW